MRTIMLAIVVTCATALVGMTTSTRAAPLVGTVLGKAIDATSQVEQVQRRRRSRRRRWRHSRWRSRRSWRRGRCHMPFVSAWVRC